MAADTDEDGHGLRLRTAAMTVERLIVATAPMPSGRCDVDTGNSGRGHGSRSAAL
jgi:hypothetical protein